MADRNPEASGQRHARSFVTTRYTHPDIAARRASNHSLRRAEAWSAHSGKRIVPLRGAIIDLLLAHREFQSVERQRAAQLSSEAGCIFADETGRAANPRTDWDGWKRLLATVWRPRRAPPRCPSHLSHRSSAARRALAHDHERFGLVNHRDGEPLHARNQADPQ
jgi:hypothetical protein